MIHLASRARRRLAAIALCVLAGGVCTHLPTSAATIEGQHFDDAIKIANQPLKLNGVGLRGVAFLRAFVAGLYVEKLGTDAAALIDEPGAKRISIKLLMDAPIDVFVGAITNGVKKNTSPDEQAAMADRVAAFQANVRAVNETHVGDQIDLDYVPKRGLVFSFNGKERGQPIPGDDLYRAIMKMFIGERAVDKNLRQGLLAGGAEQIAARGVKPAGVATSAPSSASAASSASQPASLPASAPLPADPASLPGNVAQRNTPANP